MGYGEQAGRWGQEERLWPQRQQQIIRRKENKRKKDQRKEGRQQKVWHNPEGFLKQIRRAQAFQGLMPEAGCAVKLKAYFDEGLLCKEAASTAFRILLDAHGLFQLHTGTAPA
jgi:hypothetical protein